MSDSTVEFTHRNNLKTPKITKSSVGAKKTRRYNEDTGLTWHAWHLQKGKRRGDSKGRKKKHRKRQLNRICDVWSGG